MAKLIYTCDEWKSSSSMTLKGIFTNNEAFLKAIRKLKKDNDIELDNGEITDLKEWPIRTINNNFIYLYVEEIELNELN